MIEKMLNQKNENYNVLDISIEELIPNTFDNCVVTNFEGHHTLDIPSTMTGALLNSWLKTRGGIFSKDIHRYINKKPYGKYVLYEGTINKFIARLINEDELILFESLKLVDGHLKDKPYMVLKTINEDDSLTIIKRYGSSEESFEENNTIETKISEDDEQNKDIQCISLFEED